MNLITSNTPCPNAKGTDAKHVVKLQSYGVCILCGEKVGPDVGPIVIPVVVPPPPRSGWWSPTNTLDGWSIIHSDGTRSAALFDSQVDAQIEADRRNFPKED